jgi:hypothetical protein
MAGSLRQWTELAAPNERPSPWAAKISTPGPQVRAAPAAITWNARVTLLAPSTIRRPMLPVASSIPASYHGDKTCCMANRAGL